MVAAIEEEQTEGPLNFNADAILLGTLVVHLLLHMTQHGILTTNLGARQ